MKANSVSLLPEFRSTATIGVREITVLESSRSDLAIRQGPWKLVFLADGAKELYNFEADLSETKGLAAAQPEVVARLSRLMQRTVDNRHSTPGAPKRTPSLFRCRADANKPSP